MPEVQVLVQAQVLTAAVRPRPLVLPSAPLWVGPLALPSYNWYVVVPLVVEGAAGVAVVVEEGQRCAYSATRAEELGTDHDADVEGSASGRHTAWPHAWGSVVVALAVAAGVAVGRDLARSNRSVLDEEDRPAAAGRDSSTANGTTARRRYCVSRSDRSDRREWYVVVQSNLVEDKVSQRVPRVEEVRQRQQEPKRQAEEQLHQ